MFLVLNVLNVCDVGKHRVIIYKPTFKRKTKDTITDAAQEAAPRCDTKQGKYIGKLCAKA